ncbi:hypothetical protein SAMN04489806_1966 [Paramicrobacterium humi]|uniref:DUF4232 domain-containing protein n=1 Tax=Paramicrobacterium humi TaxID=640635 RepID=A0A1H4MTS6_9MICO|nr:hypothetical protein [Microbacterium humi]SEB85925.1 hypothetical protein SAMN04489806_1966 [Microbacterium humi]
MSAKQGPHGRQPRSVYIKRRLWVLAGLIAVVAIIVLVIWRPGSSSGAQEQPKTVATKTAEPSTAATEAAADDSETVSECSKDTVEVKAITDKTTYASGEEPQLSLSITNTGEAPCTIDVGTSQQVFTITSGKDTYWTSTDCQTEPTNAETTLEPGKTLTSKPAIAWDRTSSDPSTCDSDKRPAVAADGASYHLTTSVAGITSEKTAQFVLY